MPLKQIILLHSRSQAQADLQDAKTLKVRVQQLEQLLASEQAAKASLTQVGTGKGRGGAIML
jgi:hypothetical protein